MKILNDIVTLLKELPLSQANYLRIKNEVKCIQDTDSLKGVLSFLTEITHPKNQHEKYYQYSSLFAEYFCTLSSLGLFSIAYYYKDYTALFAATLSTLSHALPLQRLSEIDFVGKLMVFKKVLYNYDVLIESPKIILWGAGSLTIKLVDALITHRYLDRIGSALHVAWQIGAAITLLKFNNVKFKMDEKKLNELKLPPHLRNRQPKKTKDYIKEIAEIIIHHCTNPKNYRCSIL